LTYHDCNEIIHESHVAGHFILRMPEQSPGKVVGVDHSINLLVCNVTMAPLSHLCIYELTILMVAKSIYNPPRQN